jgi:hypothetical protein
MEDRTKERTRFVMDVTNCIVVDPVGNHVTFPDGMSRFEAIGLLVAYATALNCSEATRLGAGIARTEAEVTCGDK